MKYLHIMPPSQRMMYGYLSMLQKGIDDNEHKVLFMSPLVGKDCGLILFKKLFYFTFFYVRKVTKNLNQKLRITWAKSAEVV